MVSGMRIPRITCDIQAMIANAVPSIIPVTKPSAAKEQGLATTREINTGR